MAASTCGALPRAHGRAVRFVMAIVGTDGVEKMSKSYGNYIGLSDASNDMYGKSLSIPDTLIYTYYELATDVPGTKLAEVKAQLADPVVNPRNIKRELARTIVSMYYSDDEAVRAEEAFDKLFIKKEIPDDIPEFHLTIEGTEIGILELLSVTNLVPSKSEARRLIQQGGVTVNSQKISNVNEIISLQNENIVKVGKRNFLKIITG